MMTYLIEGRDVLEPLDFNRLFRSNQLHKTGKIADIKNIETRSQSIKDSTKLLEDTYEINQHSSDRGLNLKAVQIMSSPIVTLNVESEIKQALQLFETKHIRHLPVVTENNRLVGIVSERDIYRQLSRLNINLENLTSLKEEAKINPFMSNDVITANQDTDIKDIAKIFVQSHVGSVPIVADNYLVGIVTRGDILEILFQRLSLEEWG